MQPDPSPQGTKAGSCGRKCEVWSRVVGYHRPVANFNDGKKEEFKNRKPYSLPTRPAQAEKG